MPSFVDARHVELFRHPVERAYPWLVDYQEDDARTGSAVVAGRQVVQRKGDTILLDTDIRTPFGVKPRRAEITLDPAKHRWDARVVSGYGLGNLTHYALTPTPEGGSRLEIHYRLHARNGAQRAFHTLTRPLFLQRVTAMWKGFHAEMDKDLGGA